MSALDDALKAGEAQIGTEVGLSNWITVDQAMIDKFAETTHDEQWIHVDPVRAAAESPFGGTIAHGFLTLSLASRFSYDCFSMLPGQVMSINYGMNKVRFLNPVRAGSKLRGRFVMKSIDARNERELLRTNILTIEIEGEEAPAAVVEALGVLVFSS